MAQATGNAFQLLSLGEERNARAIAKALPPPEQALQAAQGATGRAARKKKDRSAGRQQHAATHQQPAQQASLGAGRPLHGSPPAAGLLTDPAFIAEQQRLWQQHASFRASAQASTSPQRAAVATAAAARSAAGVATDVEDWIFEQAPEQQASLAEQHATAGALSAPAAAPPPAAAPEVAEAALLSNPQLVAEQQRLCQQLQAQRAQQLGSRPAVPAASRPARLPAPSPPASSSHTASRAAPAPPLASFPPLAAAVDDGGWGMPAAGLAWGEEGDNELSDLLAGALGGAAASRQPPQLSQQPHCPPPPQQQLAAERDDCDLAAFPPELLAEQRRLWEQLQQRQPPQHQQQPQHPPWSPGARAEEQRPTAGNFAHVITACPKASPLPCSGALRPGTDGSSIASGLQRAGSGLQRAGSGLQRAGSGLQRAGSSAASALSEDSFPDLPPRTLPLGGPHAGLQLSPAAHRSPARRGVRGRPPGMRPPGAGVRVLHAASPSLGSCDSDSDASAAGNEFYDLPRVSKADLEWDLRMEGFVELDESAREAAQVALATDYAVQERTLLAIYGAMVDRPGSSGGGGGCASPGPAPETMHAMMSKADRRQHGEAAGQLQSPGLELEARTGTAGMGGDWRGLKQWMADNGWVLQKGRSGGHHKYKRLLPVSGRTQTITISSTPSDAIRGLRNTASELVKKQREALAWEAAAAAQE